MKAVSEVDIDFAMFWEDMCCKTGPMISPEVAAGMDAAALRRQYGQQIVMWGNVDKRALARGPKDVDAELARLAPVAARGRFIPLVDHGVPDDVPLENYLYYVERRKELFGGSRSG